ncbi:MAG: HDOD domain-containing protein [Deferrisomatales bacterium]
MTAGGNGADRFAFLDTIRELPSLPQVLVAVSRVAADPSSSAPDLAEVILKDQALTLKVLRIANSAQYALTAQRVATVSRAVVLLGFESVRAIALGIGAYHLLSTLERGGRILEGFWTHAVATAVLAQDLARLMGIEVPEEAFVAGLLHDVGKVVLAEHDPFAAAGVYGFGLSGPALLAAETAAFGVDHVEAGAELARRWELPEMLRIAIGRHHRHYPAPPQDRGDRLAFLVGVARGLSEPLRDGKASPRDLASGTARLLRKPVGNLLELLQGAPKRIAEFARFFDLRVDDLKTYTLWVEDENRRLHEAQSREEAVRRRSERQQAEMGAIRDVHAMLLDRHPPAAVAERVLRAVAEVSGARRVVLGRLAGVPGIVVAWAWHGEVTPGFSGSFHFRLQDGGAVAEALTRRSAVNVFDRGLPYFQRLLSTAEADALDAPSFALVPLVAAGEPIGVLYADRGEGDEPFVDDELQTLTTLADLASLALRGP